MATYDPKRPRPRPAAAPDLDALLGAAAPEDDAPPAAVVEDDAAALDPATQSPENAPVSSDPVSNDPVPNDPVPGAVQHALPRRAEPLDQRISRALPIVPVAGMLALFVLTRWWRRRSR